MKTCKTIEQAIAAFKDHILAKRSIAGNWYIHKTYEDGTFEGQYYTEIICLRNGRLFVGGDIDDVVFGYHGARRDLSIEDNYRSRVAWMGKCESMSYVQEKACIGMTDNGALSSAFNPEYATESIEWQIEQLDEDETDLLAAWKEALEMVKYGCHHQGLAQHIYESTEDAELCDIGMTISPRVIYAWAALRRLSEILEL